MTPCQWHDHQVLVKLGLEEPIWRTREKPDSPASLDFISSADLDSGDFETEWLIPGVLTRGEPGMIAGQMKTCKTSIAIDAVISIATATPFLGRFDVPEPARIGLVSAESGRGTIQETARRVAASKEVDLSEISRAVWAFNVPSLADPDRAVATLTDAVASNGLEALILGPLYLALGGDGNEGNVFVMGQRLKPLSEVVADTGVTLILCHHARKSGRNNPFSPMELSDIAFSGSGEWMRQWMLLARRQRYSPDCPGEHQLWLSVGGSAGHSGEYALDIAEGSRDDEGGRRWEVFINSLSDLQNIRSSEAESQKEASKRDTLERNRGRILEAMRELCPASKSSIRNASVKDWQYFTLAWESLIRDGLIAATGDEKYGLWIVAPEPLGSDDGTPGTVEA